MKKYMLGVIAIVGVIVFSAFTDTNKSKSTDPLIFVYDGTPNGEGNPQNYDLKATQEQECFADEGELCEVIAQPIDPEATVLRPDLSTAEHFYRP